MHKYFHVTTLILLLLTAGCQPAPSRTIDPSGFELVFEISACWPENVILDTSRDTLSYGALSVEQHLTTDQLNQIHEKVVEIDFFEYPEVFVVPEQEILGYQAPSGTYKLTVMEGQQMHSVTWTDEFLTDYQDEVKLRELAELVNRAIRSHPEHQEFFNSLMGCA